MCSLFRLQVLNFPILFYITHYFSAEKVGVWSAPWNFVPDFKPVYLMGIWYEYREDEHKHCVFIVFPFIHSFKWDNFYTVNPFKLRTYDIDVDAFTCQKRLVTEINKMSILLFSRVLINEWLAIGQVDPNFPHNNVSLRLRLKSYFISQECFRFNIS